jgi:hypothetical protein
MDSRWLTALVGLVASLAISVYAWIYFDTFLFFLLIPFVPLLFTRRSRPETKRCPRCGFETAETEFEYCPRDGARLE